MGGGVAWVGEGTGVGPAASVLWVRAHPVWFQDVALGAANLQSASE